jgi:hypothetical protein
MALYYAGNIAGEWLSIYDSYAGGLGFRSRPRVAVTPLRFYASHFLKENDGSVP